MGNYGTNDSTIDQAIWVYEVIRWHMESEERAPVVRELMVMCNMPSSAVVQTYLNLLHGWGWIAWIPKQARTMRLTRPTENIIVRKRKAGKRRAA